MATSVTHMGSEAIKPRLDARAKHACFERAFKTNLLDLFPGASSSDENSVKTNSALAHLSASNVHMESITLAQIK